MQRFHLNDLPSQPWKNGRGSTRVVHSEGNRDDGVDFDWRISVAEITESGPFSVFTGVERIAVVLENGPLYLCRAPAIGEVIQHQYVALRHKPLSFHGDQELHAYISGDATLCLNIMTRRSKVRAEVQVFHDSCLIRPTHQVMLFAVSEGWEIDQVPLLKYSGVFARDGKRPIRIRSPASATEPLIAVTIIPIVSARASHLEAAFQDR